MSERSPGMLVLEDGSRFPRPALESDEHHSPAHAVRWYGAEALDGEDQWWLVACADAFGDLIENPTEARRKIAMIRRAIAQESGGLES